MPVIVGGSPSTGSSLLRQMLNRHPEVYCGPETSLFAFPQLFEDWNGSKGKLLSQRGLTAPDIQLTRGTDLIGHEQQWERSGLVELMTESASLPAFADAYFARPMRVYGASIWAEKTPANVLNFKAFHRAFEEPVVVHVVRDPLDTIASLVTRGLSVHAAVSRYLFNTAFGLSAKDLTGYVEVKYEQLVTDPERALTAVLERMDLSYTHEMVSPGNSEMREAPTMKGWLHSEVDAPSDKGIGRFSELPADVQALVLSGLHLLRIRPRFLLANELEHQSVADICSALDYPMFAGTPSTAHRAQLARQRRRDVLRSLKERRTFLLAKRPIRLTKV